MNDNATPSLRSFLSEPLKAKYRKVKTVPAKVKALVYAGCLDPSAAVQFQCDVMVYGVYGALLYVEDYEEDGYFAPGTALAAAKVLK